MSMKLNMVGFEGIERALLDLPRGTARGVTRRALKKELKPVADMANAFWPGSGDNVFRITSKIGRGQYGESAADFSKTVVNMFVGAAGAPQAHLLEFGTGPRRQTTTGRDTGQVSPLPMLQPAWDRNKKQLLEGLGARMWDEIVKTQARRAKKAAKR